MVKTRIVSDAKTFKPYYDEAISRFGSSFTLEVETKIVDSLGNLTTDTVAVSTVCGDFQRITEQTELEKYGLSGSGNGKFFGKSENTFYAKNILVINSERWQFRRRVDDDAFGNTQIANTWLLVKMDG